MYLTFKFVSDHQNFATHIDKSKNFKFLKKNNVCSITINDVICKNFHKGQKKSANFLKGLAMLKTSLLKNFRKISSLSCKTWGVVTQKVASEKYGCATSKEA